MKCEVKLKLPEKARATLRPFLSSAMKQSIPAILLLLFHSVVIVSKVPSVWSFVPTNRNPTSGRINRRKRLFSERGSVRDAERPSFPLEKQQTIRLAESNQVEKKRKSRITSIRCENFAGMTNGQHKESPEDENVIVLKFAETTEASSVSAEESREQYGDTNDTANFGGNLVCVTGETGSGKSLLVARIAELLAGGKASVSLLQSARNSTGREEANDDGDDESLEVPPLSATSAEMVLELNDAVHVSFVSKTLHRMGLDPTVVLQQTDDEGIINNQQETGVMLKLKRVISMTPVSVASSHKKDINGKGKQRQRMKSTCFINDHPVPLKVLKAIASPLVAVVNAPVAAAALGRSALRLSMIDTGIPHSVLVWVAKLQTAYRECKQYRESLENDLEKQVLPASMVRQGASDSSSDNSQQLELLHHWIEELDGFERRVNDLRESLCRSGSQASIKQIGDDHLEFLMNDLNALDWTSDSDQVGDTYTSSLYETFLELHAYLKSLDERIVTATEVRESLASVSASDSARSALDRTRQLLLEASPAPPQRNIDIGKASKMATNKKSSSNSRIGIAAEQAHEMLNLVEDALSECANFLDDDEKGLVATLKASRRSCSISTEELLEYISEWNVLARKHGVSPYQLPLCHGTLKKELDGGIEAGRLLPEAKIAEKEALMELEKGCRVLTEARSKLCRRVSASISRRLPRLGMENSKFEARLFAIDSPSYTKSHVGTDGVDFYLLHEDQNTRNMNSIESRNDSGDEQLGGKVESVASSGEKARLLLAIECEIPGSISAIGCESLIAGDGDHSSYMSPVAVIYDEIDAHVGGRASISVAQMLFDQSKACQVVSITHSPSLAAIADTHICVHRGRSDMNGRLFDVVANQVEGVERRKELARMASGDMVVDEAEVFAEALLRDASSIKSRKQKLQP